MIRFKIKVCGITRVYDAKAAIKYGADILGFIFFRKSPRYISSARALEIIKSLPATVEKVGVFVNEPVDGIIKIARKLRLDYIQLSGDELNKDVLILKKNGLKVIKTIRVKPETDFLKVPSSPDIIHLDNADKDQYGGSGESFDWKIKLPEKLNNIMLAGGINIDNVQKGVKKFSPLIVDVNSGVEYKPGMKSDKKLKAFMKLCNKIRYGK